MIHRDEIHGDIRYDRLAVKLLDTPQLQRLGRVYQLGFGHLVYRGGTHTRLSHSMGAYLTASQLAEALQRNYESSTPRPDGAIDPNEFLPAAPPNDFGEREELGFRWTVFRHLVAWAALLHDVGHVPIGHTLEDEFADIYQRHDAFGSPRFRYLWLDQASEIRQVLQDTALYPRAFAELGLANGDRVLKAVILICSWKERNTPRGRTSFERILDATIEDSNKKKGEVEAAKQLRGAMDEVGPTRDEVRPTLDEVRPTLFRPCMADLVANTISADYLDYLRRDPHNLGLDVLRDGRIISRFWIGKDHLEQARMALSLVDRRGKPRLDTCTSVVELVRQRYRFAEIVYYHKTKVAASAMLAKVFHLLEAPAEVPTKPRTLPSIANAGDRVEEIFKATDNTRSGLLAELRADCTPSSLLDPEVGDEGLGLFLRSRAIELLGQAVRDRDKKKDARKKAKDAVRSIALLDGLSRRQLYKTKFTMDPRLFPAIAGSREMPEADQERRLQEFIGELRKDSATRDKIEREMVEAAGWQPCSILIYVPDRKSQAKGIETGALADGEVVTLGSHPVVADEVEQLSARYRALWRLIVLVHPDHANDEVGLSNAIDAFVENRFPDVDLTSHGAIDAIERGCWFSYKDWRCREAAEEFARLVGGGSGEPIDWNAFDEYGRTHQECTSRQHGRGAIVLHRLELRGNGNGRSLVPHLGDPGDLDERIERLFSAEVGNASLTGDENGDLRARALDSAINTVVDELAKRRLNS